MLPTPQQYQRKPFHESVCRKVAITITAMSISGGQENPLGVQQVNSDLDLLDQTKIPAAALPDLTKELYGLRVMYGPLMPVVAERLTTSIDLLVMYQGELVASGDLEPDRMWAPPVVDPVA